MKKNRILAAAAAAAFAALAPLPAFADLTIGVSISLTGPTSALGIPTKNGIALWPKEIAGEKLNVIVLDDATDPTTAVKNTSKFINEDKVDVIIGSVATPVAAAMADVAAEGKTVQLMLSPVNLPEGRGGWSFRMPQSTAVMAIPIVEHWKKTRRQDLRLPRLFRRVRRSLAQGHQAARREGRHQAGRGRAIRAHRHGGDRPGAEADVGQPRCDPRRRLGQRRGDAAQGPGRARLPQGQDLPDPRRGDDGPDPRRRRRRRRLVRVVRPGRGRREAARLERQQGARRAVQERVRERQRQGLGEPVRGARVRRRHRAAEGGADRAEEGQAGHARVPRRPEGRVRDDGPHAGLAGRPQLDRDRSLRLHAGDRRAAEGREAATGRSFR